ncbi:Phosphoribosyl transferase domain protein [Alkalibacterium sp. AK22]|nr:Phosphoribosyl transferase domain protein [Alkalibacterium sp. AK22]
MDPQKTIVLALPRGGVPLGIEIARQHGLRFDMLLSKKIGHPLHPEYAIGAIAELGEPIINEKEMRRIDPVWLQQEIQSLRRQMHKRRALYDQWLLVQRIKGQTVIFVDDGIATGMTMKAAVQSVKDQKASHIIVAVPVVPENTCQDLLKQVDAVAAVDIPRHFLGAVGAYYRHFPQVEDKEVEQMLSQLD